MKIAPLIVALVMAMAPAAPPGTRHQTETADPKASHRKRRATLMNLEHDTLAALSARRCRVRARLRRRRRLDYSRWFAADEVTIGRRPEIGRPGRGVVWNLRHEGARLGDSAVVTYVTSDKGKYEGQASADVFAGPMSSFVAAAHGGSSLRREHRSAAPE